ncbi:tetratricopeptide repeat protein 28 [Exaiptasia diaphana]|uniref:CHAT domain-containing protein n=1 Tax=Exaiptasia diaphana TaxID=2652724 RepID=A0A913X0S2_EXADI|nr:tetratricopeptide repeat protein 28 [Exaiptasia diaphana]KXJ27502.1 Tetratricopeptide repeat protein 28 [Exaiptasia diaphana]
MSLSQHEEGTQLDDFMSLGDFLFQSCGQFDKAIEIYKKCLEVISGDRNIEIAIYQRISAAYQAIGDFDNAVEYNRKCVSIATTEIASSYTEGHACRDLACSLYLSGKLKEAVEYYEKSLTILVHSDDKDTKGKIYAELGVVYQSLQQYQQAIECNTKCLCIVKEIENKQVEGTAHANLGMVYEAIGKYTEAAEHFNKRLAIAKDMGDIQTEGKAYGYLGVISLSLGRYQEAIEYHQKLLHVATAIGDKDQEGNAYGYLGEAYQSLGKYYEAIEYYEKRLVIAKEIGNKQGEGNAYSSLGNIHISLGKFEEALEFQKNTLDIVTMIGDRKGEGTTCGNIGSTYFVLRKYDKAIEYHQKHVDIASELGDKQGEVVGYVNIGRAYSSLGEYHKAIELCEKSLDTSVEIGDKKRQASAYGVMGGAHLRLGELKKAMEYYKKQLNIAVELDDKESEGKTHNDIGNVYRIVPDKTVDNDFLYKAKEHFERGIQCFEELFDNLKEKDQFKISIFDTFIQVYKNLTEVLIRAEDIEEALLACERGKSRALDDLLSMKFTLKDMATRDLLNLGDPQKISLTRGVGIVMCDMFHDSFVRYWMISPHTQEIFFYSDEDIVPGKSEAGGILPENEGDSSLQTLIEHSYSNMKLRRMHCEDRSAAVLESEDKSPIGIQEPRWVCEDQEDENPLQELYERIVVPIQKNLIQDEIVIIPDGSLYMVPFSALQDSSGNFLSESKCIRLAPSLTTLKILQDSSEEHYAKSGALIVGNPEIPKVKYKGKTRSFPALPCAENEAIEIANLLGVEPLTRKQATKEAVLQNVQSGVSVIHIAAHGSVDGKIFLAPSESVETGCIPEEQNYVLTIKEAQERGISAQLVVLSCCHSGRGEIKAEGVVGMTRAFLAAGARAVVASLWAIDDQATMHFMKKFYSHLKKGTSASRSLQQAMKEMRETEKYKEPMYWAGFFLIGDDVIITSLVKE